MQNLKTSWLNRISNRSLDLLFPPRCLSCGIAVDEFGKANLLCSDCQQQVFASHDSVCRRCGARLPDLTDPQATCLRCEADNLRFDATYALGAYEGILRELVLRLKTDRTEKLGRLFAQLIEVRWGEELRRLKIDAIVPIPMSFPRRLLKGTNPPEVIARQLAAIFDWQHFPHLLNRRRNSLPQHGLTRPGRFRNIRGGLAVSRGYHLSSPHLMLVDDVLTTGATCSEAARILKKNGASRVSVVVVGRTPDS